MIQPNRLLESLFYIATRYQEFAIFWHLVIYLLLFFIIKQRRLPVVSLSLMIALLFFSVSAFAWQVKNPFNLAAFIMLGVSLIAASISLKRGSITFSSLQFSTITGIVSLLAGLFYPHFFGSDWIKYLYAAPVGLIPCPTLLVAGGIVLIFMRNVPAWRLIILLVFEMFYGTVGAFVLGVGMDYFLYITAAGLLYLLFIRFAAHKYSRKSPEQIHAYN